MNSTSVQSELLRVLEEHQAAVRSLVELAPGLETLAAATVDSLRAGGKLLLFGNGGSAADAQHLAAEFTGRFERERQPLAALALTTDTSALTAVGNDYGYEHVFERQLRALARPGDVALGISTSGDSPNVLRTLVVAQELGCRTFGLSGRGGGKMNALLGPQNLVVGATAAARVQECHILLGHLLCSMVESELASG